MDLAAAEALADDLLQEWGGVPEVAHRTVDVLAHMAPVLANQVDLSVVMPAAVLLPVLGMARCSIGGDAVTEDDLLAAGASPPVVRLVSRATREPWQTVSEFEDDLMDGCHEVRVLIGARRVAEVWVRGGHQAAWGSTPRSDR